MTFCVRMDSKGNQKHVDSGWSWVVLASSWLALFTVSVLSAGAGILQVEIIEEFQAGAGVVSIMTSIAVGMASLIGPLSGIIANLLSVRYAVFLGATLMAVGMLCVSFTYSLPLMMFFYSIVTGVGLGICYSPLVVVISFYFEKHRILATGILFCAPGTAVFSLPYLVRYLIDMEGWRFTFGILGSIILHVLIFASVFFPTEMEKEKMIKMSTLCFWKNFSRNRNKVMKKKINQERHLDVDAIMTISKKKCSQNCPLLEENGTSNIFKKISEVTADGIHIPFESKTVGMKSSLPNETFLSVTDVSNLKERRSSGISCNSEQLSQLSLKSDIPLKKADSQIAGSTVLISSLMGSSLIISAKIEEDSLDKGKTGTISSFKRVYKSKALWILNINAMLFMSGSGVHAIHFPAFAESKGMSHLQVSEFYMVYGLVMVIGRLTGGFLFNRCKSHLLILLFILELCNGIILGLSPVYANTEGGMFAMMAGIGLVYGQSYILIAPLLAKILSINDLPLAFGINQLFIGIGYTVAPILAGFLYDATLSYDLSMMLGGCSTGLGAVILFPLLCSTKLCCLKKRQSDSCETQPNFSNVKEWDIEA